MMEGSDIARTQQGKGRSLLSTQTWVTATSILVFTTILSKAMGFLRDVLVANAFGASAQVDAFVIASTLAAVVAGIGSALSVTFIPLYRRTLAADGPARASWLAGGVVGLALVVSLAAILVFVVVPHVLIGLVAPRLPGSTAALTVTLMRWLTGLALGLTMIYVLSGIYNAMEHFKIPAFMDLASNVIVIVALVSLSAALGIRALALGFSAGTLLVAAAMAAPIFLRGIARFNLALRDSGIRELTLLAMPVFAWELLAQGSGLVENFFGASLEPGSVAALGYAKRLSVIVVSLLAVNIARAVFPVLSRLIAEGKLPEAKDLFLKLTNQYLMAFVPASIALMYFRRDIVGVIFQRGAFDVAAAERTAAVLLFYAAGIAISAAMAVFIRACYAFADTVTPLLAYAAALLAMTGFNVLLTPHLGVRGIALSTTLALIPSILIMGAVLARRFGGLEVGRLVRVGVLATGCGLAALLPVVLLQARGITGGLGGIIVALMVYMGGYGVLGRFAMPREVRALWRLVRHGD